MSNPRVVWILLLMPWVGWSQSTSSSAANHENDMTQALIAEMKGYFAENQGLIDHTLAVYQYAEQLRQKEGGDVLTVRSAALYHDIGIPEARRVHGSAAGKFQEKEGPPIARRILSELNLESTRADFICRIIANHHTAQDEETTSTVEFKIIWDADALVNLRRKQGKTDEDTFHRIIHDTFRTETGLQRAKALFLSEKPGPETRPRLIVLTDFFKDPDDKQSLIRLLVYANELDIEGLLATSLAFGDGAVHPEWIRELIGLYERVLPKLRQHARPGTVYPSAASLTDVVRAGAPVIRSYVGRNKGFSVPYPPGARDNRRCGPADQWMGLGQDTPASEHIIAVVDRNDPRPVWVTVWGGAMDLAQALWKVRHERTTAETDRFVRKLRVYQISWQDTGIVWVWENFPKLFLIQSSTAFRGIYLEGSPHLRDETWVDTHMRYHHGPLGGAYPQAKQPGVKEGDTPAFLNLLCLGLSNPDFPEWGGWGGRFQKLDPARNVYVDVPDKHPESESPARQCQWTVGRWNKAASNELASRMDWCVYDVAHANHRPAAHLNGDRGTEVLYMGTSPGQTIDLSADGSNDPDGDRLTYHWWQYLEAGSMDRTVGMNNPDGKKCSFTVPAVDSVRTIHIILEVTDNGIPNLTAYRRLVVTVEPERKL